MRSIIDTYLEDGKKIFKHLYTCNWFSQEENLAEMLCEGCSDLLLDLWEWIPNKLYRSFILLGIIEEIIDIYHLHILYVNVNEYNTNHTNNEPNSLNIFHSTSSYYNANTNKTNSGSGLGKLRRSSKTSNNNIAGPSIINNNQKYFMCENEILQFGMEHDLNTYITMISKQLKYAEGPAFKSGVKSIKAHFKKATHFIHFFHSHHL